jgi:outer membrane protein OmpA-like peptidoglycan-associated protein
MIERAIVVPALLAASLVATGCATKSFVREQVQQSEAKTNESVGRVDTAVGQERGRVDGLIVQVTDVSNRAGAANNLAGEAANRAEVAANKADAANGTATQALARADQTDSRLTRLWSNRSRYNTGDSMVIRFGFDRAQVDDRGETALLDVIRQLQENPNLIVALEGYTDSQGPAEYNVQLSQRRVDAVRRFLVEKGVELHRIHSIGLGPARPAAENTTPKGRGENRRVAVHLLVPAE